MWYTAYRHDDCYTVKPLKWPVQLTEVHFTEISIHFISSLSVRISILLVWCVEIQVIYMWLLSQLILYDITYTKSTKFSYFFDKDEKFERFPFSLLFHFVIECCSSISLLFIVDLRSVDLSSIRHYVNQTSVITTDRIAIQTFAIYHLPIYMSFSHPPLYVSCYLLLFSLPSLSLHSSHLSSMCTLMLILPAVYVLRNK